ncbi:SGNH/GDSL hydrolase family protein [Streptacidiphilus carbonis]|uniref:SGNH/GDSL hydrolase family protein n=1 Tax=Streptacidiphilus carbonis TaxID=105422 RepID=UPI0005AA50DE|nr:SGNH/GDSL hydrolase family protein [Streptacidiphilus carbonis]
MRNHLRTGVVCVLACGALVAAVGLTQSSRDDGTAPVGPYVALGDSYTSGPDIPDQNGTPLGCDRSSQNYPALVAAALKLQPAQITDRSCSGATTADLAGQQSTGNGTNPAQFSALTSETRLVTLGIGGNDIGFSSLLTRCVETGVLYYAVRFGANGSGDAPCRAQFVADGTDQVQQRIDGAADKVSAALAEIRKRSPKARVYVVGYPAILPDGGEGCARALGLAPGDVSYLRQKEQDLNAMLQREAKAAGAGYVDTFGPSTGHDACSAESSRWIEPLVPSSPAAAVHPNARGEQGMAGAVLKTVNG